MMRLFVFVCILWYVHEQARVQLTHSATRNVLFGNYCIWSVKYIRNFTMIMLLVVCHTFPFWHSHCIASLCRTHFILGTLLSLIQHLSLSLWFWLCHAIFRCKRTCLHCTITNAVFAPKIHCHMSLVCSQLLLLPSLPSPSSSSSLAFRPYLIINASEKRSNR